MEPEASKSAIAAISALQQRIRDLESETAILDEECQILVQKVETRDSEYAMREKAFNEASERAKQMLSNSSTALIQIREARTEGERISQQISETRVLLRDQNRKIADNNACRKRSKLDRAKIAQRLSEYELLLGDIARPTPGLSDLSPEDRVLIAASESDPMVLPPPFSKVLAELQRMPKAFRRQGIDNKRQIIRALFGAEASINDLSAKIKNLEKQKFASSTPRAFEGKIKREMAHRLILQNETNKFELR